MVEIRVPAYDPKTVARQRWIAARFCSTQCGIEWLVNRHAGKVRGQS